MFRCHDTAGSQHPGGGLATGTAPQGGPAPDAAAAAGYELVAILVHKGSSASHGHYGAAAGGVCCNSLVWMTDPSNRSSETYP